MSKNSRKMVNYYVSYNWNINGQTGYGCVSLDTGEITHAGHVLELANEIARLLSMPKNSVLILWYKEFSIDKTPKMPDNGWN